MRFLLSVAMIVAATGLICHGLFKDEEAAAELKSARDERALQRVAHDWPYSDAAVKARGQLLDQWIAAKKPPEGGSYFESASGRVQQAFGDKVPFVDPYGACAIGVGGLILATLMPKTRFRSLAVLVLLAAVLAAGPAFMEPGHQINLIEKFEPLKQALAQLPRIAVGTLFLAGLVMGPRRGSKD